MNRCHRCVLPETFPGADLGENNLCRLCRHSTPPEKQTAQKARLQHRFDTLIRHVQPQPRHHCLMAWSGGKDSTYTLWLLTQKYHLRVLAFTFDNGFVSPAAFKNVRTVAENLNVDHIIIKPRFDVLRQIFRASLEPDMYPPRALERASAICNSCMALAKGIALRIALNWHLPMLAYGWSPGQIPLASAHFRTNRRMLEAMIKTAKSPLAKAAGESIDVYFPETRQLAETQEFPYMVAPLAFLEYDEEKALRRIRQLGWERPRDTDPNSTNCLLNSLGIVVHQEQLGYHPYAMEVASLVRTGCMTREEALERLQAEPSPEVVAAAEAKLGIGPSHREDE